MSRRIFRYSVMAAFAAFGVISGGCADAADALKMLSMSRDAQQAEGAVFAPVTEGSLVESVSALARVDVNVAHETALRPRGEGKVDAVLVTPGQRVQRGQILLRYVDHSLHGLSLDLRQAQVGLDAARASLAEASAAYRRGVVLAGAALAQGEVDRRRAAMFEARDLVASREASLGMLEHRLKEEFNSVSERIEHEESSVLIAPMDAVVRAVHVGTAMDIDSNTVAIDLVDTSSAWVTADVLPDDAEQLVVGGHMRVRPAGRPEAHFMDARLTTIDPMADPQTGLVRVIGEFPAGEGKNMPPGMMLDAALDTTRKATGLRVPLAAIQHVSGHDVVFVRHGAEQFEPRVVQVALQTADGAVVTGGLTAGESVMAQGSLALKALLAMSDGGEN
ncbi:efflux RND transporter periplasmic adaptor subunit [Neokomagataea thailandica]|nr:MULTISPECIES: efflux RND transporter periplasmic adaptor subunit [Neokomagataea]